MRAMTESMTTRLAAAWSALVLAVTALFAAGPALAADAAGPGATATGPDIAVSQAGNYPTQPNSYGNFSVQWTSVGTADAAGITHLTVDLPPGLRTSGALMYSTPYDYTFSERVSPDGRHLEATFRGTRVPGRGDFMKVQVSSGAERPSGVIRATVANRDDVNPANNVSTYTVNGPQQPAEVPDRPVVTAIDTVTGPGAGGTAVTLTGTGLDTGFVLFGGEEAKNVSCTATQCTATSPGGSGSVPVTVVTPGGAAGAPSGFVYTGPPPAPPAAPVVTGLSVRGGPARGGTSVYVLGSNLSGGTIAFGGAPAAHVSCGDSFCSSTSPAGSGTVHVTVTTAGGTSATVDADRFTYTDATPRR
ncbi:IPT/TIG domain-containing protein [Streptomyces rimosus]|uniref:IPT/TIG domain-containing protein n=1 Tax=Streptomyces rimosus TaxID=1927 RepID=UPI00099807F4|nr:IPT/TIG domain-containing protein [Streptomyces rimosus]